MPSSNATLGNGVFKIFFGARNNNQSLVSYAVVDLTRSHNPLVEISTKPVLSPGIGTFDDNGVLPSCFIEKDGQGTALYHWVGELQEWISLAVLR